MMISVSMQVILLAFLARIILSSSLPCSLLQEEEIVDCILLWLLSEFDLWKAEAEGQKMGREK